MKNYPSWSCWECGKKHGQVADRISTWHYGRCDVCGENNNVTEPRDFGHFPNWFKTKKGNKMKNLAVVLLAVGLQACSTVSKETYTETRTLTYPKNKDPHLKEMYLRDNNGAQEQNTYIGTTEPVVSQPPSYQPPVVNNYQGDMDFLTNPDLPVQHPESEDEMYARLAKENRMLNALSYNQMLRRNAGL